MSLVSVSSHDMYSGADTTPLRGIGSVLQQKSIYLKHWIEAKIISGTKIG
jgi:hypothetical protein